MKTHFLWLSLLCGLAWTSAWAADQTATWNSSTGNWSDSTKWSTNPLVPNNGNGGFTFDAVQTGGTLSVDQAITIQKFNLSGGANASAGFTLTLNELFTWTGGAFSGAGTIQANGGASFSGGTKLISALRVLNLGGNSTWTAGGIGVGSSGVITNQIGFTFDTNFDGTLSNPFGGASTFNNAGVFTKSAGAGTTSLGAAFNNTGTANVNTGTLTLIAGGASTGTFNVSSGAALNFGGSTHTLSGAANVNGAGTMQVSAGTTNFNAGTFAVSGTTTISGGTANFNATASTNVLNFSGGTLGGTGALTASGLMTFSGGGMTGAGTVQANGGANFSGAGNKDISALHVLNLGGNSTWTAGGIRLGTGGTITNQTGFTFTTNFDGTLNNPFGGGGTFNNAGTFTKSGGAGTTSVATNVAFNNTGTVNVNSGTLGLGNVTQHSATTLTGGTWNVTNAAAIDITTGSNIQTNQANVTLDGAGSSFARLTTALNNNQGSLTLKNDRDLTTAGAFANSGSMSVQDATTVMTVGTSGSSAYTQTDGATTLMGGATIDPSVFNLNGGTLSGTGTISAPLTATSGAAAIIAPGSGIGTLQTGNANLGTGTILALDFASPALADQIVVTGSVTLSGTVNLALTLSYTPTAADTFVIIANDDMDAVSGLLAFSGTPLAEGASFTFVGVGWTISYVGGTGNDVTLTVAPTSSPLAIASFNVAAPSGGGSGKQEQGSITGAAGAAVQLQRSSNLIDWTLLSTITLNGSGFAVFDVTDPLATDRGFYRLVIP